MTSAFIWRCRDGSSGKGYLLALNASQICTHCRKVRLTAPRAHHHCRYSPLQNGCRTRLGRMHGTGGLQEHNHQSSFQEKEMPPFKCLYKSAQFMRVQSRLCDLIG